jgi:hypothetical protein
MSTRRFNWPLWAGLLLSFVAFMSYFAVFVMFPVTRDFPWANLLLFALALVLLFAGLRRGFSADRPHPTRSKIVASMVAGLGVLVLGFFVFVMFIAARWLPGSQGAPHIGQKAPDFTLSDTNNNQVALSALLASQPGGKPTTGVLLIFYRGYW